MIGNVDDAIVELIGNVVKSQKVNDEKLLELEEKRLQMEGRQLEREAEQRREDRKFLMDMMAMMMSHQTAANSPYHSIAYNTYPHQPFDKYAECHSSCRPCRSMLVCHCTKCP